MSIKLEIYTPEKNIGKYTADKVIVPVAEGNLTIICERAPRSALLTKGCIVLLNEHNQSLKKWHITGGIMEVASDICKVAVEEITESDISASSDL